MIVVACLALPAAAQERVRVMSGTGFFVNQQTVVTNAHVVRGCTRVTVQGAVPLQKAEVQAVDDARDLAIINVAQPPERFAPLRLNIEQLGEGDGVFVIGYPGARGADGETTFATGKVEHLSSDFQDNPERFYISEIVNHGNSGGPVFDASGHVIGVVVAMTTWTTADAQTHAVLNREPLGVAITLATLKRFLFEQGVFAQWSGSSASVKPEGDIEDNLKAYIVNVQCEQTGEKK